MKKTILLSISLILLSALSLGAKEYTLTEYLDLVERNSKELKLARQDLEIADATKAEAVSGALPHVSAQAGYTRNLSDMYMYMDMGALTDDESAGTSKFPITRNNEFSAYVTASQTLFSGAVYNAVRAARQYRKLSDFVYDASYQEIITSAKKAFHQALLLRVVLEVTQASQQNAYENYQDVSKAFDNGLASQFGLLQAEVRYKEMIPQTTEAERNYSIALINLKNLAGIPLEEEIGLAGNLDAYPDLPTMKPLDAVLESRPDFNALLWEEKLRATNVSAEKSAFLPTLTGSLSYVFSSQSDRWRFDEKNDNYTLGLTLSVPIFTGGATKAKVQKARIELDRTRISIDRARDMIELEQENIRLRLEEAYNRIASAKAALTAAQKAFDIAEATSKVGLSTQLELKDSRTMLDLATTGYYSAVYEYLDAYFDYEKSMGAAVSSASM